MDPSVIITVILALLATGGAGGAARVFLYRLKRRRMKRALTDQRDHLQPDETGRVSVSLLDVFWDLGASDFAMTFMERQSLLCETPEAPDVDAAHGQLASLIEAHGSYREFISESRSVIEDFDDSRGTPGSRRQIHTLAIRRRRVLYDDGSQRASMSPTLSQSTPGPPSRKRLEDDRQPRRLPPAADAETATSRGDAVDLEDIDELDIGELFKSATEGRLTDRLQSWWEQRELRALKSDLDDEFRAMYALYADRAEADGEFYDQVYDVADRWAEEADRLQRLSDDWQNGEEPTSLARSVLAELSGEAAETIAEEVERRTAQTIETIHAHARAGDEAMAGYLVYLNRHAFFAGRDSTYTTHAERIERMAQEMREAGR